MNEWPERDDLPTQDPIGDTEESCMIVSPQFYDKIMEEIEKEDSEWVDSYKKWQEEQIAYEKSMEPHLLNPEGKISEQVIPETKKDEDNLWRNIYKSHYERPDLKSFSDACSEIVKSYVDNLYNIGEPGGFELPCNKGKFLREVKPECTCGTQAVYGKVPNAAHAPSCDLRKLSI